MKRTISVILSAIMLLAVLAGCGEKAPASTLQTRSFTDSTGRTLELPAQISKIAVTGQMAQIFVFALAPDMLVGTASEWDEAQKPYIGEKYLSLPALGQLYGGKGELNLESLLSAAPQVVIDVGESKDGIAEDMDKLTAQTGIPFVHIDADLASYASAYTMLGELLDMPDEAKTLSDYCTEAYKKISAIADGAEKQKLLYVVGEGGLNVIAAGSYHSEVIDLMAENLAVLDEPSSKGTGNEVDMEQILNWNPGVVIFESKTAFDNAQTDAVWQQVAAVKTGKTYLAPAQPYNWMGFPPCVQRYLGMLWLGKTLYPEQADYELYDEVSKYFGLFYHCELSQEQFTAIIGENG